jgi:NAD(P)-dependent dehydrogenase (short-subunit alcohol dehydrogenase family)
VKALIYGASGDLARAITSSFQSVGWQADRLVRGGGGYAPVRKAYSEFQPNELHDAYVFPQAVFLKRPLAETTPEEIESVLGVGLVEIAKCLANVLSAPAPPEKRIDYALVGSTSSYAGFKDTALYCAAKHGLVGLVRALNEEYSATGRRFWLFSMGTMDTAMGRRLVDQDPATFLPPSEVANRIVEAITSPTNLFEPEVIIRRRAIRYLKA